MESSDSSIGNCSDIQDSEMMYYNLSAMDYTSAGGAFGNESVGVPSMDIFQTTMSNTEWYFKVVVFGVTMAVALLGNTGVILTVALNRKMRSTINCYLMNLAVADLVVCVFCMFTHLSKHLAGNIVPGYMCRIEPFAQVVAVTSSVLSLSAISCDRFTAIIFPFHVRIMKQRTGWVIAAIWILSVLVALPMYIFNTAYVLQVGDLELEACGHTWPKVVRWHPASKECVVYFPLKRVYYVLVTVVLFFIPVIVMTSAYSLIIWRLWRERQPGERNANNINVQYRARRKVVRMVCVVLLVFFLCWMPLQFIIFFSEFRTDYSAVLPEWFTNSTFWCSYLAYANSALNPIIYAGLNHNFRQGLCSVMRCGYKSKDFNKTRWSQRSRLTITTGNNNSSSPGSRSVRIHHKVSNAGSTTTTLMQTKILTLPSANNSKKSSSEHSPESDHNDGKEGYLMTSVC